MNTRNLLFAAVGVLVVGAGIGVLLKVQSGRYLELGGAVLKVRTLPLDESATLMVVDARIRNLADYPWVVKSVTLSVQDSAGAWHDGVPIARRDLDRLFQVQRLAGPKFNELLIIKDRIPARQTLDRMAAARVELAEAVVEQRRNLRLRFEELDGNVSEILERGPN